MKNVTDATARVWIYAKCWCSCLLVNLKRCLWLCRIEALFIENAESIKISPIREEIALWANWLRLFATTSMPSFFSERSMSRESQQTSNSGSKNGHCGISCLSFLVPMLRLKMFSTRYNSNFESIFCSLALQKAPMKCFFFASRFYQWNETSLVT